MSKSEQEIDRELHPNGAEDFQNFLEKFCKKGNHEWWTLNGKKRCKWCGTGYGKPLFHNPDETCPHCGSVLRVN